MNEKMFLQIECDKLEEIKDDITIELTNIMAAFIEPGDVTLSDHTTISDYIESLDAFIQQLKKLSEKFNQATEEVKAKLEKENMEEKARILIYDKFKIYAAELIKKFIDENK